MDDTAAVLKSPLFAGLPVATQSHIAQLFSFEAIAGGARIFREGQRIDSVYVVVSGQIALDMDVPGRGAQRMLSLGPGDLLGWTPLFADGAAIASATALVDTVLCRIPGHALRALCAKEPLVGYHFMREVAQSLGRRLLATRLQMLDLFGA